MPKQRTHAPRILDRLRRDLRAQGIDPDSVSGRWLLRLLSRGERATSEASETPPTEKRKEK